MSTAVLSFHLSESMECDQLSIKEEAEDETKYGSYGLHPDTGVLGEASTKVNKRLPLCGGYIYSKKKCYIAHIVKNFKNKKNDIRRIHWLCMIFSHVALGIFYLLILSCSVTVPLRSWDRGR